MATQRGLFDNLNGPKKKKKKKEGSMSLARLKSAASRVRGGKTKRVRPAGLLRRKRKAHPSRKRQRGAYKGLVRAHQAGRRCSARVSGRQCFRTATRGTKCSSHARRRKVRKVRGRTGRSRKKKVAKRRRTLKKRKRKLHTGKRGGKYYIRKGRRVYI